MKKLALAVLIFLGGLPLLPMDCYFGPTKPSKVPALFTIAEKKLHAHWVTLIETKGIKQFIPIFNASPLYVRLPFVYHIIFKKQLTNVTPCVDLIDQLLAMKPWKDEKSLVEETDRAVLAFLRKKILTDRSHQHLFCSAIDLDEHMVINFLLDNNLADIHEVSSLGKQPLHYAVERDNVPLVGRILQMTIAVNAQDEQKLTPLHYVQSVSMAELLLKHGANIDAEDFRRTTPLGIVKSSCKSELYNYLLKFPRNQ